MNTRTFWLLLGLLALMPLAHSAEQDFAVRLEQSLRSAESLVDVEIEFLDTFWLKDASSLEGLKPGTAFWRTCQYSYLSSGPKYRTECKLISGSATNSARGFLSTFNGDVYATYEAAKGYMTQKRGDVVGDNGASPLNPLVAPFMFLSQRSDDCITCNLRFTDIVSRKLTHGVGLPITARRTNGLIEVSMPGLPLGKHPTKWKVVLDEDGDYFNPGKITLISPGWESENDYTLLNYTNLGAYHFPTVIKWTSFAYPRTSPPTVLCTGMVMVVSAHIPALVKESDFTLTKEEKSAAVVWDWDQRKLTKTASQYTEAIAASKTLRIILLVGLCLSAITVILVAKRFARPNCP